MTGCKQRTSHHNTNRCVESNKQKQDTVRVGNDWTVFQWLQQQYSLRSSSSSSSYRAFTRSLAPRPIRFIRFSVFICSFVFIAPAQLQPHKRSRPMAHSIFLEPMRRTTNRYGYRGIVVKKAEPRVHVCVCVCVYVCADEDDDVTGSLSQMRLLCGPVRNKDNTPTRFQRSSEMT